MKKLLMLLLSIILSANHCFASYSLNILNRTGRDIWCAIGLYSTSQIVFVSIPRNASGQITTSLIPNLTSSFVLMVQPQNFKWQILNLGYSPQKVGDKEYLVLSSNSDFSPFLQFLRLPYRTYSPSNKRKVWPAIDGFCLNVEIDSITDVQFCLSGTAGSCLTKPCNQI